MMFDNGFASYMIKFNMREDKGGVAAKTYKVQRNWAIICLLGISILCGVAVYNSTRLRHAMLRQDFIDENGYNNKSQLSSNILPTAYILYLHPRIEAKSYSGHIKINMLCQHDTSEIVLHSLQHKVKDIWLKCKDKDVEIKSYYRNTNGLLIVKLNKNLTAGVMYKLRIDFDNRLADGLSSGIYLDTFVDGNGKISKLLTTNFVHKDARRAWPCFDEPSLKATWQITIKHPRSGFNVISNMPVLEKNIIDDEHVESKFTITPKMSSSNVAVVVTPYEYKTIYSPRKVKINVYAPAGRLNETNFAIKLAPLAADLFAEDLKLSYTSSKLDLVPYPVLTSDAEQSLGLIPAVESLLLYDSSTTSVSGLENIAEKVLHEISKQWFGKLMDDSWLRKALASYMKDVALQKFFPSWNLESKLYSSVVEKALKAESNDNAITHGKGTALINMLAKMLGNDALLKGFRVYLNKYNLNKPGISQVWKALTEVTPSIDVNTFMNYWTNQTGFPLITLKLDGNTLLIKQERFGYKNSSGATDDSFWQVPITVEMCGKVFHFTLKKKSEKVSRKHVCGNKAYKANYGGNGYYRVNYDDKNWKNLLKLLNTNNKMLPAVDRGNLLADVYSLVRHNHADIKLLLDFTQYLRKEHEFVPWEIGSNILTDLKNTFSDTTLKNCFEKYMAKLVHPVIDYLDTFKTHSHPQKKLVVLMLNLALKHKIEPVTSDLQTIFWKWMLSRGRNTLPAYIREPIIRAGVMSGKVKEWNFIMEMYENAKSVREKQMLLQALTYTNNKDLLQRLVQHIMNFTHKEDQVSVLTDMCANPVGRDLAWNAAKVVWKSLDDRSSPDSIMRLLNECLGSGSSYADLTEAKAFKRLVKSATKKYVDQVIKRIELNMELRKKQKEAASWFHKKFPSCFKRS